MANIVGVYVATNAFRNDMDQYSNICNVTLAEASSSQIDIVRAAMQGLNAVYRKGMAYKKAGVVLSGISSAQSVQMSLFNQNEEKNIEKKERLSKLIDKINGTAGMNTVHLASQMPHNECESSKSKSGDVFLNNLRREHISPKYTTEWTDIMRVK